MRDLIFRFLVAAVLALPGAAAATNVRIQTAFGVIDIRLYDTEAPLTVANFLSYVSSGAYDGSFIHRSVQNGIFIVQGGGYNWNTTTNSVDTVTASAPIVNEYSDARPNKRSTISMARTSDPNSATSQWFLNNADNSTTLGAANGGGYAVFGEVIGNGMSLVDAIASLSTVNAGSPFNTLPIVTALTSNTVMQENLVTLSKVTSTAQATGASDSDRVFAYAEAAYSQYLAPANPLSTPSAHSGQAGVYYYRYYASTNAYIGTADGNFYYLGPASGDQVLLLGTLAEWLSTAAAAGY